MSRVPFAEAAERIKSGLDIIDVIQRYVILKKTGRNYTGKCPFHNDKNPSMNISREKGIFKCFSCGVGGDSLSFLMRIENKTYGEIIRDLAQEQGIDIAFEGQNAEVATVQRDARQKILDLNTSAAQWFQEQLLAPDQPPAFSYLAARYPEEQSRLAVMQGFQLGYAPAGWENLTPYLKERFDFVQANPDLLTTAGLANNREHGQGHYDRFRNRLIIPILDDKGAVVAFGGRALSDEDKPKYLNSPETVVYKKSNVLYGFYQAKDSIRQSKSAIVMEGYFDVISAHLAGITEAVGSCGTAMTDSHLKLLTRFGAETVYLAFDSDEAGLKAALSAITLIEPYLGSSELHLKVLIVPDGKDPDDFIRQHGGDAFRTLQDHAKHFLAFKFDMALRGLALDTPDGRIQAANRITALLLGIESRTTRSEYIKLYAEQIGISEEALLLEVKRHEQSQNANYEKPWGSFKDSQKKKAISSKGSTSLKRNEPRLTDNLTELRSQLTPRQVTAEKNLLKLSLYNVESFSLMMSVLEVNTCSFVEPLHQDILDGLRSLALSGDSANTDPLAYGFPGTLIEKMNHLYFNKQDVINTFAELALTADSFCDSVGLGELKGSQFQEKITILAGEQLQVLADCHRKRQLQMLKYATQQDGDEVELTYQFQERLADPTARSQDGIAQSSS